LNVSKKLDEQKEEDDYDKNIECKNLDIKIENAKNRIKKAGKTKKISGFIAGASLLSAMFISPALVVIFPNLIWLSFICLGVSFSTFATFLSIWTKKNNKIFDEEELIRKLGDQKAEIMETKSEKFHVLEIEIDLEHRILDELFNDYRTLTKYAKKKEPEKIAKGKIEARKAKSFKEKVDKIIEEDSNLLNK